MGGARRCTDSEGLRRRDVAFTSHGFRWVCGEGAPPDGCVRGVNPARLAWPWGVGVDSGGHRTTRVRETIMRARFGAVGVVLLMCTSAASADTCGISKNRNKSRYSPTSGVCGTARSLSWIRTAGRLFLSWQSAFCVHLRPQPLQLRAGPCQRLDRLAHCQDGAGTNDISRYDWRSRSRTCRTHRHRGL
jgi:hypothetical protein